jgi:hypothetical protein
MDEKKLDHMSLLSPREKFIEIQKQDWQIEALIIGSIIIGLVQIPNMVDAYHLRFMDLFGLRVICVETILNLPFAFLLINLLIVMLVRGIWIIEAFGMKRVELMNDYNDLASSYFGNSIQIFLLYLGGAFFWTAVNIFLPDNLLSFRIIQITTALIFYGCIGLIGWKFIFSISNIISENDRLFIFVFAFAVTLLCPFYFLIFRCKFKSLLRRILNLGNNQLKKKIKFLYLLDLVFYLIVAIYFIILTSWTGFDINKDSQEFKFDIHNPKSPIKLDSDNFDDSCIECFIHAAVLEKKYGTEELDESKVIFELDGNVLKLDWITTINEFGNGLKTYLCDSYFKKGFNRVILKTTRNGKERTYELVLHKPSD